MSTRSTRRGRPPSGNPEWNPRRKIWEAHLRRRDGTRIPPVAIDGVGELEVERAASVAKIIAERHANGTFVPAGESITVAKWFEKYYAAAERGEVGRKNRGKPQASAADRRTRFTNWIEPIIGGLAM